MLLFLLKKENTCEGKYTKEYLWMIGLTHLSACSSENRVSKFGLISFANILTKNWKKPKILVHFRENDR